MYFSKYLPCPVCKHSVTITKKGNVRKHNYKGDSSSDECPASRYPYGEVFKDKEGNFRTSCDY